MQISSCLLSVSRSLPHCSSSSAAQAVIPQLELATNLRRSFHNPNLNPPTPYNVYNLYSYAHLAQCLNGVLVGAFSVIVWTSIFAIVSPHPPALLRLSGHKIKCYSSSEKRMGGLEMFLSFIMTCSCWFFVAKRLFLVSTA